MKKIIVMSIVASSMLLASGYRIPEQSTASTAKAAAHVAHITGADASYFNPAAMSTLSNKSQLEMGATIIHLPAVDFNGTGAESYKSEKENFLLPYMHYVSPKVDKYTFGLSMVAPAGLSKRWKDPVPRTSAQEFSLRVVEINPTVAYEVNSDFSIGGGLRIIYSDGIVKSNGTAPVDLTAFGLGINYSDIARDMTGDTIEFGYNLALHYHPNNDWTVGLTYRSEINLNEEGQATLTNTTTTPIGAIAAGSYIGSTSVSVPVPAVLALGVAYDISEKTNIEFVIDRTYWSAYGSLDFKYPTTLANNILIGAFDDVKYKNWKNVNAYRIGVTHQYSDKLTLMGGFAYDETPVPDSTIGYELPDSDAFLISGGFSYKMDEQLTIGAAYLYDKKESRAATVGGTIGEFSDGGAHMFNFSLGYTF
ncbi:MAG: OmpP1/FadL family transporter [Campylobacterota bacterium]|nr:OmpP1/FadL family transporter [Campylobacterota bacterium]